MKIYNFDNYPLSDRNGTYGGNSGDKEGILINDKYYLIKYPKNAKRLKNVKDMSYSCSPLSEYIGSHIYNILDIPVHNTLLGIRNEHIVVACEDLCDDFHKLIEFRQLKNTFNKKLNEKLDLSMSSTGSEHFVNLEEIMIHLEYNPSLKDILGIKKRFWDCVIVDGFINNSDRNNGNWGILRGKDGDKLASVFDNGAAFSPNVSDVKLLNKLNNNDIFVNSINNNITVYSLDNENNIFFKDIVTLDIPELQNSIKRIVPRIKKSLEKINLLIDEIPKKVGEYFIISDERKTIYKAELDYRLKNFLEPAYKKCIENEKKISNKRNKNNYEYER